jgi:hypothetical protein
MSSVQGLIEPCLMTFLLSYCLAKTKIDELSSIYII